MPAGALLIEALELADHSRPFKSSILSDLAIGFRTFGSHKERHRSIVSLRSVVKVFY